VIASLHALLEGWLRGVSLKKLGFVNSLKCIFGHRCGVWLKLHHHESYKQAPYSTHQYENMIDNIGHMLCLLGISEFSVNMLSLCSSCCSTAAVQRPEMQDKTLLF